MLINNININNSNHLCVPLGILINKICIYDITYNILT